jgi:hypothetical protein
VNSLLGWYPCALSPPKTIILVSNYATEWWALSSGRSPFYKTEIHTKEARSNKKSSEEKVYVWVESMMPPKRTKTFNYLLKIIEWAHLFSGDYPSAGIGSHFIGNSSVLSKSN